MEDRPLLKAHTDMHLVSKGVHLALLKFLPLFLHHGLEVHIYLDALKLIVRFSLTFKFPHLLHF